MGKRWAVGSLVTGVMVLGILLLSVLTVSADDGTEVKAPVSNPPVGRSQALGAPTPPVRFQYDVATPTGDPICAGVEYDGNFFWVTGVRDWYTLPHKLYKFDKFGNYITSHDQPTTSDTGWVDMAWDGRYLYASDWLSLIIDQIDPTTGAVTGVIIPSPVACVALAYDRDEDHFWVADMASGSDIYEVDRSGTVVNQYPDLRGLTKFGFAWDNVCSDRPWLWVWSQNGNGCLLSLFDPIVGEFAGETYDGAVPLDGAAGGACFAYLNGRGTFVGLHQANPDSIVGYDVCGLAPKAHPPTVPAAGTAGSLALAAALGIALVVALRRRRARAQEPESN